jgi:HEAT repeat protein
MTTQELLLEMESQTHAQRIQAMVSLGRQQDARSVAIIAELERGGFYERRLALYSCFGSRDAAHVLRALNDPSWLLRGLAARLTAVVCDDESAISALNAVPADLRVRLAKALRARRRFAVLDAYVTRPETDANVVRALLPFASAEVAASLASTYSEQVTSDDWRRLARFHPALALTLLEGQIAAAAERDGRLIARVNMALPLLANAEPDRTLALVTSLRHLAPLQDIRFDVLSHRRPAAVADLILSEPRLANRRYFALGGHVEDLTVEQIVALYRLSQSIFGWNGQWFRRIPGRQRGIVFAELSQLLKRGGVIPDSIIATLPADERAREARIQLQASKNPLSLRLPYAAYLPWDEMTSTLDPYLHASDAELRQAALGGLIGAVAYHRDHLDDALEQVRQRRSEQDTTRRVELTALRKLPTSVWRAHHLPVLEEIIRHGLDDVGLSSATLQQMVGLLLKLLPGFPDWSSAQFVQILRERGWAAAAVGRPVAPTPAAELRLAQTLAPMFDIWAARDNEQAIIDAIDYLFRHPPAFALGADALESLVRRTRDHQRAVRALALFHDRAPARFGEIVPELLAKDASWITFPIVSDYLIQRRQDLATPYLTSRVYSGRWETGRQAYLPQLSARFIGGTPTQHEQYASAAMTMASDEAQESWATIRAVKSLALLPAISAARLITLADDPRPVVRTSALFALARMDTAGGLPTLLSALEDSRARIAIHALRRSLMSMPTSQALDILRGVSLDRVTVAKEVVRLLGELPSEAAYNELLAFAQRDLHRDIRIALLHALGDHLDHEQSWALLEEAARSSNRDVALAPLALTTLRSASLLAQQEDQATQRHVLRLIAALIAHPDQSVRLQALRYCSQLGIPDDERIVTPLLVNRTQEIIATAQTRAEYDEALAAAQAFFGVCASTDEAAVRAVIAALLPHRRTLREACASLTSAPRVLQRRLLPVLLAAVDALHSDPLTIKLRIAIAVERLPAAQLGDFLIEVVSSEAFHADALMNACALLDKVRTRSDAVEFEALEPRLGASPDERLRRMALAILVSRAGSAGGWDATLLERLRVYRADPSALAASAAQFIIPDSDDPGA